MFYTNQTMQESNRKALNCQVYNITFIPNHDVKKPFKKNYFYQGKNMYVRIYRRTYIAHGKSASKETWKYDDARFWISYCLFLEQELAEMNYTLVTSVLSLRY